MRAKLLHEQGERTWAVVLETDEEATETLLTFVQERGIRAGRLSAIGAFREVTLGFFDIDARDYRRIELREQVEVLSLLGNVAIVEGSGKVKLHLHAVVGKADGGACGGHLLQGWVRPTLEVLLVESPVTMRRRHDEATGLALLDLT